MKNLRKCVLAAVVVASLAVPASAAAYTVTVKVHGAGTVTELTDRQLMNCSVSLAGKSESSVTDCVAGTPEGNYQWADVVNLEASVSTTAYNRGWRFEKWVDGEGGGRINCDPQGTKGDHTSPTCQFQVFDNLYVDLHFVDAEGPQDTSISGGPTGLTQQTSAAFTFNAPSDPDARFDCKLDTPTGEGNWSACGSPSDKAESLAGLTANGQYTFSVRGRDPSGNVDATPASRSWTVDTVAPLITVSSTPPALTNSRSATFAFITSDLSATTKCMLEMEGTDGATLTPCESPKAYSALPDGTHWFTVMATDQAGNATSQVHSWTIDTVAPQITISGGPAALTNREDADFTVETDDPAAVSCKLEGPGGETTVGCDAPIADLADGTHKFTASSTDAAGNTGSSHHTWTVDTAAPETTVDSGPDRFTSHTTPTFEFSSDDENSTFECWVDTSAAAPCNDGTFTQGTALSDEAHVFYVVAIDPAGNADPTPAALEFTVDTVAPVARITKKPKSKLRLRKKGRIPVTFKFAARGEKGASFRCKLDRAPARSCTSPQRYRVNRGKHAFKVWAIDAAGNTSRPAKAKFRVVKRRR